MIQVQAPAARAGPAASASSSNHQVRAPARRAACPEEAHCHGSRFNAQPGPGPGRRRVQRCRATTLRSRRRRQLGLRDSQQLSDIVITLNTSITSLPPPRFRPAGGHEPPRTRMTRRREAWSTQPDCARAPGPLGPAGHVAVHWHQSIIVPCDSLRVHDRKDCPSP